MAETVHDPPAATAAHDVAEYVVPSTGGGTSAGQRHRNIGLESTPVVHVMFAAGLAVSDEAHVGTHFCPFGSVDPSPHVTDPATTGSVQESHPSGIQRPEKVLNDPLARHTTDAGTPTGTNPIEHDTVAVHDAATSTVPAVQPIGTRTPLGTGTSSAFWHAHAPGVPLHVLFARHTNGAGDATGTSPVAQAVASEHVSPTATAPATHCAA